ncbi:MAG: CBS domain-containing protein [Nitrospirales bacterium]|nr:CBS domain-containing protein [Nitrospirales bacterium]
MAQPNLNKKARDIMNTRVMTAARQFSGRDLAILFLSGTFSGLPVVDPGNKLVGVVTEFDILKALAARKDLHVMTAETLMSPLPICVEESTTAEEIIQMMITHQVIRIPVVHEGKLVGVISRSDLLNHLIDAHLINVYGA